MFGATRKMVVGMTAVLGFGAAWGWGAPVSMVGSYNTSVAGLVKVDRLGSSVNGQNVGTMTLNGFPYGGVVGDLGSAPGGGVVYAMGGSASQADLFEVNPTNASLQYVGPLQLLGFDVPDLRNGGLAVKPNGDLRAVGVVGGKATLFGVNSGSAALTVQGDLTLLGFPLDVSQVTGLASSLSGETYGMFTVAGNLGLYKVAEDGATTFLGNPTLGGITLEAPYSDLAFDGDGKLYTSARVGGVTSLFSVNLSNANLTLLGNVISNGFAADTPLTGLAVVPEAGVWSVGLVAGLVGLARRRRM